MTAALLGPAFLKAADTLSEELNQQLIEKSAAVGGAQPALDYYYYKGQNTIQPF